MKRRHLNKKPGIGDFTNKCSEIVKGYDAKLIRVIYETIHENVYWKGSFSGSTKRDFINEIEALLRKQKVIVFHLDQIVEEILIYFGGNFTRSSKSL